MKREVRNDFMVQRLPAAQTTSYGGRVVPAKLTRIGVFEYFDPSYPDNIRREYRPSEEVFAPEHLETLKSVPVTLGHPPVMINPNNYSEYSQGHLRDSLRCDGDFIVGELEISKSDAIEWLRGKEAIEVSLGYHCDIEISSGIWEGQHYHCIQRNIIANHVAIGEAPFARAGRDAALLARIDQRDNKETLGMSTKVISFDRKSGKITIGSDQFDLHTEGAKELAIHAAKRMPAVRMDAATIEQVQERAGELAISVASLQEMLVEYAAALLQADESLEQVTQNNEQIIREDTERRIKAALGHKKLFPNSEKDPMTMTASEIYREAVAAKGYPVQDRSDSELAAMFSVMVDYADARTDLARADHTEFLRKPASSIAAPSQNKSSKYGFDWKKEFDANSSK